MLASTGHLEFRRHASFTRALTPRVWPLDRPVRVVALLSVVVALSLVDLGLTLHHMRTIGLLEGNPIVRLLASATDSGISLALYKALTLGIAVSMLYRLRRHVQAELGAWLCLIVVVTLTICWLVYMDCIDSIDARVLMQLMAHERSYVTLD